MKPIHKDLGENGLEGQWLDIKDPKFLTKRTIERWQRDVEAGTLDSERLLREFVSAWHLVDGDTGADLNDPKTDDVGGVPLVVFQVLNEEIGRAFRGTVPAPGDGKPTGGVADGGAGGPAAAA